MTLDDVVGDGFVWLGLRMPDEAELQQGMDSLGIAGVSARDVLTPHARPVLTVEGPVVQLVLRTAAYEDRNETIALGEMTLLVGPRSVLTIRHGQASQLSSARAALEADPERLRLGPAAVVAAVVNVVIDGYGPALDGFENDVVEVERDVFSDSNPPARAAALQAQARGATDDRGDRLARRPARPPHPGARLAHAGADPPRPQRGLRPARPGRHPGPLALRPARRGAHGEPHPDLGAPERRHAQDQRLGRDGCEFPPWSPASTA